MEGMDVEAEGEFAVGLSQVSPGALLEVGSLLTFGACVNAWIYTQALSHADPGPSIDTRHAREEGRPATAGGAEPE